MGKNNEPKEVWLARARQGTTKAHRLQTYVNDDLYKWMLEFRELHGLNESKAVAACIRHVKNEYDMQRRGFKSIAEKNALDVDKIVSLRGKQEE
jgi:hypothetical protein